MKLAKFEAETERADDRLSDDQANYRTHRRVQNRFRQHEIFGGLGSCGFGQGGELRRNHQRPDSTTQGRGGSRIRRTKASLEIESRSREHRARTDGVARQAQSHLSRTRNHLQRDGQLLIYFINLFINLTSPYLLWLMFLIYYKLNF